MRKKNRFNSPPKDAAKITLTHEECRIAQYIGKLRKRENEKAGTETNIKRSLKREIYAFGAEIAFCKFRNRYPDFTTNIRHGGFDCRDDVLHWHNQRIDVKHTTRMNGRLLVTTRKEKGDNDVYVLVVGEPPIYYIVGWCFDHEIIKPEKLDRDLPHPAYALKQQELRKYGIKPNGL